MCCRNLSVISFIENDPDTNRNVANKEPKRIRSTRL
jgi:hypothetical protein